MRRAISVLLALCLCMGLATPCFAASPDVLYMTDPTGDEFHEAIKSMLYDCTYMALYSSNKSSYSRELKAIFTSEESYTAADNVFMQIRMFGSETKEILNVYQVFFPYYSDRLVEITAEGHKPGHSWSYHNVDGGGSHFGHADKSGRTDYEIDNTMTFTRSEGDWLDKIIAIAQEAAKSSDDPIAQLKYLNNYIVDNFSYYYTDPFGVYSHDVWSVEEMFSYGTGVCGGYANMISYACFYLGIPCVELESWYPYTEGHTWNCVYVNGSWKMLDVTWNYTTGNRWAYFLVDSINDNMHDYTGYGNAEIAELAKEEVINVQKEFAYRRSLDSTQNPIDDLTQPTVLNVTVRGEGIQWTDAVPFIDENGRTMVPLRAVGDALGLTVDWDSEAREAIFTNRIKTIYFPIDSSTARTSDGQSIQMDTVAVIVNGRTYAPVRYLAEFFDFTVGWDGATRTVSIS